MNPQQEINEDSPQWHKPLFEVIREQWHNHGANETLNWMSYDDDDGDHQIHVAPCFQEVLGGASDGQVVWTPFIFDIGKFIKAIRGKFIILNIAVGSHFEAVGRNPMIMIQGETVEESQKFYLTIHLEPPAESNAREVIDTIHNEVREKGPYNDAQERDT